jgi:hypothetical protein
MCFFEMVVNIKGISKHMLSSSTTGHVWAYFVCCACDMGRLIEERMPYQQGEQTQGREIVIFYIPTRNMKAASVLHSF